MKILKLILAAILAAIVTLPVFAQKNGEYLDLSQDPFVHGGLNENIVSKELLPAFAGYAPQVASEEVVTFAFNYDIPKLQLAFRDSKGKVHTRTGKLRAGEKLVATINKKIDRGSDWEIDATVRWANHCGNPMPFPFRVVLTVPKMGPQIVIKKVEVPAPYAVIVKENTVLQQIVPSLGDLVLNIPSAEAGRHRLIEVGREEAGRRWEYQKNFWDNFLDFVKVVACPLAQIFQRATSVNVASFALGGAGGQGGMGGNSSSSSSSSSASSASASAAAAAAGG